MATAKTPRPSPTESAADFEIGTVRIGNDENKYIVAVDKNGRHRWAKHQMTTDVKPKKVTKEKKSAQVSDNEEVEQEQPKPKAKRVSKKKQVDQVEEPKVEEPKVEEPKAKAKRVSKKKQAEQIEEVEEVKVEEVEEPEQPKEVKKNVRKAPAESAKNYEEGYEMIGEDGKMHVVKLMNNNVKRWVHAH
jgi:hypothetical protein